jgi:hypothetical protein
MALTRIRVLNQQSTYNVDRLNANTLVVGGNNITGASGAGGGIVISSVVYLAANGTPLIANAAPTSGNSVIKIIGSGFAANANVFLNGSLQPSANVTFVDSTELRLNMPALASNTYSLFTFNTAGAGAIFYSGVRFDPYPIWTTGEYTAVGNVSTQLLVTGYGSGSITFSLASGNTLPSGLSLAANGLLSGTTTANTFNFYVNATDSENEITTQQISLTVAFPDTYFPYTTLLLSASSQTANNVSTETFTDSSNNNFDVTATGTPYQGTFTPFPTTGTWSNHLSSGSTYLSTSEAALSALATSGAYTTIEAWVNVPSFRTGPAAYNHPCILGLGNTYMNFGVNNGFPKFHWYDNGTTTLESSIAITVNIWNHIAVVFNGSGSNNLKIYVNGVLGATGTFTRLSPAAPRVLYIGIEGDTPNTSYWLGYISNLRITNSALYTSTFTPSTTPLTAIANTTLLTCQSNRFIDNSTNAYTVSPAGSIKVQRFNPFGSNGLSYSPLTDGGSIYFDGSSYLTMASNSSFAFGTGNFTVEGWINPTSLPTYCTICSTRTASGTTAGWNIGVSSSGQLFLYAENFKVSLGQNGVGGVLVNTWSHFAIVRSGTELKAYVNGIQSGPTGSDGNDYTIQTFWTGITGGTSEAWFGYISNLRILKGTALYTSTFTPPTVPFVPITNTSLLLLGSNSKFLDSTKINNIRNVGGVATRTDIKNYGTNSWYFNGSSYLTMLNNPIFNFPKDFTIELWLYNVSTVFYGNIFSTTANYVTANGLRLTTGPSNNTFSVGIGNSGSVTGNTTFSNNTWVHVALVRSGTSLTIYQNGINIGTGTESTAFINDTMVIGTVSAAGGGAGGPYNLNAYIQDFRITNGIARYTTTFAPPTGPVLTT